MKKDVVLNEYFKQKEVFADLVNLTLYQGRKVIQAQELKEADPVYGDRRRDILKEGVMKEDEKRRVVIYGIENQSEMDPIMPVRVMEYDVREYRKQIEEAKKKQRRGELKGGEFLSGVRKEIKLKPVITIVLYSGEGRWEGARKLSELIEGGKEEGMNEYEIKIVEVGEIGEEEIERCESGVGKIIRIMKYSREKEKLIEYLRREENEEVEEKTARVIEAITKIPMRKKEEGGINVCRAIEEYTKECKEIGRKEGEQIGKEAGQKEEKIKTAKRMIADGFSDEMITRYVELSIKKIQRIRKQLITKA